MIAATILSQVTRIEKLTTEHERLRALLTELRQAAESYVNDPRPQTERILRTVILACKAVGV